MSVSELSKYIFASKYARWIPEKKRRENWQETVSRIKSMMIEKYKEKIEGDKTILDEIEWAYSLMNDKWLVGSQRTTQFAGSAIFKHYLRGYNCSATYVDRLRVFQEIMYVLLAGCGAGFSVQRHHVDKLPTFCFSRDRRDCVPIRTYSIPDSIEGWADSIGVLLSSYFNSPIFPEYHRCKVEFDYSLIRSKGSPISSCNGKAPGAAPLRKALENIDKLLRRCIENGQSKLRPIDSHDLICYVADSVLSGGVRRAALISLFSADDEEMMKCKTGSWFYENPQRGRANNSAVLLRKVTTFAKFNSLIKYTKEYGEPGFLWVDSLEQLTNPCFRYDTRIATNNGLIKIGDLVNNDKTEVICDNRVLKDNIIDKNYGTTIKCASGVKLTQKNAKIFRVTTEHSLYVDATENHIFITTEGRKELKDLEIGDKLLLQSDKGKFGTFGTFNQGLILGLITSDGFASPSETAALCIWEQDFGYEEQLTSILKEELQKIPSLNPHRDSTEYDVKFSDCYQVGAKKKKHVSGPRLYRFLKDVLKINNPVSIKDKLPDCLWIGSEEFIKGFLNGFLFGDGTINFAGHKTKATLSIRFNQSNKELLGEIQLLLLNFGIVSRLYLRREKGERLLPDSNRNLKLYDCKDNFEIVISRPNLIRYLDYVGVFGDKKQTLLNYLEIRGYECRLPERYISKIKSIKFIGIEDVYCLNEPETNSIISNGIVNAQCGEISLTGIDEESGDTGWQTCNLCSINGKKIKTKEEFLKCCKAAAIIGTLQAGFDKFPYLGQTSENIIKREALLGVSICGIMDQPDLLLDPDIQKEGAKLVVKTNEEFAKKLGINPASRCTTVKPDGTVSLLFKSASGIHPNHARRYFRRVQANKLENIYQHFKKNNPLACEKCTNTNNDDEAITFCVEVEKGAKLKNDVSAIQLLEAVKLTQNNWIKYGTNDKRLVKPYLRHNVSNTVTVKEEEWEQVIKYIFDNRDAFAGISLLPNSGDLDYPMAPFTAVHTPKEILETYGEASLFVSGLIVKGLEIYDNNLWKACDAALGIGENLEDLIKERNTCIELSEQEYSIAIEMLDEKINWLSDITKFAGRYLEGNIRKLTYLMKEVHNWKYWLDLQREYKKVNYEECIEECDNTKFSEDVACSAGSCEIIRT